MQPNSEIFHHIQRFLESAHNYCTIPILNSPYKYFFYVWTQSTVIRTFHIRKHTLDNLWDSDILIQSNSSDLCLLALKFWLNPLPAWAWKIGWLCTRFFVTLHSLENMLVGVLWLVIPQDKWDIQINIFLISPWKHILWYSLEAPRRGASNEYPQHMFSWRNKKTSIYFWWKQNYFIW